jgi:nucleoside-diphosphate-sugar epimerase
MLKLLLTGGDSTHGRIIIHALRGVFALRVVDTHFSSPLPDGVEAQTGDLRDEAFVKAVVQDVEAVIHLMPLSLTLESEQANLEQTMLGTYYLAQAAQKAHIQRIVLGSSMKLFASAPRTWPITPAWRPRPQPHVADLCVYLAECGLRELARVGGAPTVCVRLGEADQTVAVAVQQALAARCNGWRILHAVEHSPAPAPAPIPPMVSRPIKKVVIFGAGGPMAAMAAQELAPHYLLRQTDVKPLTEIIAAGPRKDQHPGVPRALKLDPPHEEMVVDVTNFDQVMAACAGMDAVVNCSVIRHHVVNSFGVNALGAYNVMKAATIHGIRRVVHTGPFQLGIDGAAGYNWDNWVVDDVPARPGHGMNTYFHSKYLGEEIVRCFAENYGMEVPTLYFCDFADFVNLRAQSSAPHPFTTTWTDTARAIRCALETAALPSPFELLHVNSDMPQGVFPNAKAKRVLGWQPQDPTESWWLTS